MLKQPVLAEHDVATSVETAIRKRCSVRRFSDERIDDATLQRLVEAGIRAPSGSNWQNQRFLVVSDPDEIARIGEARFVWPYRNSDPQRIRQTRPAGILGEATALLIVFSDSLNNDRRGNGEYHLWEPLEIQNCSAAIENVLIMATALKIANCWVSASDGMSYTRMFSDQSWRAVLANYEIPSYYKLQGIVLLGYPTAVDDDGFPRGEKNHGATVWQSTARRPVQDYCIRPRTERSTDEIRVSRFDRFRIRFLAKTLRIAHRVSRWCDKRIHKLEIEKYLQP